MNRFENLSPKRRFVLLATVFSIFSLLLFLLAETAVRTRMYLLHGSFWSLDVRSYDKETGLLLPKPNYNIGPIRTNSFGFRSPTLELQKPDGSLRIAYLGGSTTFSAEVSDNNATWPAVTTASLQSSNPDTKFEYLNAAAIALHTRDSISVFEHRVAEHNPDITVIYHSINDIVLDGYYEALAQGKIEKYDKEKALRKKALLEASLLVELVHKNLTIATKDKPPSDGLDGKIAYNDDIAAPFRKRLSTLVDMALNVSELVVIPTFTNMLRDGLSDRQTEEAMVTHAFYVKYYGQEDLLKALISYNDVIREFAKVPRVIVIEAEDIVPPTFEYFTDSVHFTDAGSKVFGEHIAKNLDSSPLFRSVLD